MEQLKKDAQKIQETLKLKTYILGIQFFRTASTLNTIKHIKKPEGTRVFCQIITMARSYGWTIGMTLDDFVHNSVCPAMLGLYERPEFIRNGEYKGPIWFKSIEDAKKYEDSFPTIPNGKYEAVAIGPVQSEKLRPKMVLIYGNPAQLMLIINALQWENYERLTFHCVGESSCADAIAECYISEKPSMAIPCYGERRFGHAQDDELTIAIPSTSLGKIADGLQNLWKRGVRYPIPYFGVQADPNHGMPEVFKHYHSL